MIVGIAGILLLLLAFAGPLLIIYYAEEHIPLIMIISLMQITKAIIS